MGRSSVAPRQVAVRPLGVARTQSIGAPTVAPPTKARPQRGSSHGRSPRAGRAPLAGLAVAALALGSLTAPLPGASRALASASGTAVVASSNAARSAPPSASGPSASALPLAAPVDAGRGAVVVAVSAPAPVARALARDVYRREALRPAIGERSARILLGETVDGALGGKERELSEVRAGLGDLGRQPTDALLRRALASVGRELGAALVVAVVAAAEGGEPRARVLRVSTERFEGVELVAAKADDGTFTWPHVETLDALAPPRAAPMASSSASSSALPPAEPPKQGGIERSPFFWAAIGVVAAAGVAVLVAVQVTSDSGGTMRVQGRVAP
jgi:hypothetical protein